MKKINWTSVICYLVLALIVIGMQYKTTQDMQNMAETYTQQYANILTEIKKTHPETSNKIDISNIKLQPPTKEFMKDYYTVQSDWLMVWLTILAITLGFMGVIFPMIFADRKKELDETIKIADAAVKKLAKANLQEITKTLEEIQSADLDNKIKTLEQNMQDSNTKTRNDMIEIKQWKDETEANNLLSQGNYYLIDAKNPQKAIKCYDKAITIFESLGKTNAASIIYGNRGTAYSKLHKIKEAIKDYNKAAILNPNDVDNYNNRSIAYLELYRQEKKPEYIQNAVDDCDKAIELNANYAMAYCNRGNAYLERGKEQNELKDYEQALKDYEECLEKDPNNFHGNHNMSVGYLEKGNFYLEQNKLNEALSCFEEALKFQTGFATAWSQKGAVYIKKGDFENAIICNKKSLEIAPTHTVAIYGLAVAYILNKQPKEALETLKDLKNKEPKAYKISNDLKAWLNALENCPQGPEVEEIRAIIEELPDKEPKL